MANADNTAPAISGEEDTEEININHGKQFFCCVATPANHLDGFTLALIHTPPPVYLMAFSEDHAREIACSLVDPTNIWDECPFAWTVEPVPTAIEVQ